MCHQYSSRRYDSHTPHLHLVERIAARDQAALRELYRETHNKAFSIACGILDNREAAEEAVQDAYLQIWKQACSFDPRRGSPLAWMVTIVRTRSLDRLRKLSRERRQDHPEEEWKAASADDPERVSLRSEARNRVRSALKQLKIEQRTLIEQAYYGGLSHREMAAQMQIPLGTIKTRIRTAMRRLREFLEPFELASPLD